MGSIENTNFSMSKMSGVESVSNFYQNTHAIEKINKNTSGNKSDIINNTDNGTVSDESSFFTTKNILIITGIIVIAVIVTYYCTKHVYVQQIVEKDGIIAGQTQELLQAKSAVRRTSSTIQ
jgi:hypothetical protein